MRSKLFQERPETARTDSERWVRIFPDKGEGYVLYDALEERMLGRILVDQNDNWIYDGTLLTLEEQEDLAAFITGSRKEMDDLILGL
ncbi:hypothetical protein GSY63_01385 [Mucilaginibacter sp. R11]|uniref:Uncharacterized protein n=1 Tax=Mucilaginibacter agri TaxID=2695265 RepID=A0A966DS93_9SPHI|nr:hypothetical protein [Mucilaginibacter agri]